MSCRWRVLIGALLAGWALVTACSDSTQPNAPQRATPSATGPPLLPPPPPPTPRGDEYVYVANADGSGATRIALGAWPAWSPGGNQLLIERGGGVFVVNIEGSGERRIIDGRTPAWSPDGRRIAFATDDGISIAGADGTNVRLVVPHNFRTDTYQPDDMGVSEPAWSPDGVHIAFEHLGDGDTTPATAFVVDTGGGAPIRISGLSNIQYAESDPSWSPDGLQILYWSFGYGIATVNVGGGGIGPHTLLKNFPTVAYGARPVWSKNNVIAYVTFALEKPTQDLYVMSAAGGSPRLLISDAYEPAWSRDGARIAFVSRGVH